MSREQPPRRGKAIQGKPVKAFKGKPAQRGGRAGAARGEAFGLIPGRPERLHKVMAHAGVASRRSSEELILAGRVKVNGEVVRELGTKVMPGVDRIEVDGQALGQPETLVYVMLNKPRGVVTTLHDPEARPTVAELVAEVPVRVFPVGRLDYDTEGLLLLTNDGELAHGLMHPARQVWKTYVARVRGVPNASKLRQLEQGVELEDGPTAPARVQLLGVKSERKNPANQIAYVEIQIYEGRNRQVRRMFEAIGHEVVGLARSRVGPLRMTQLAPGEFRYLSLREIRDARRAVDLPPDPPRALHPIHGEQPGPRRAEAEVRTGPARGPFRPQKTPEFRPAPRGGARADTGPAGQLRPKPPARVTGKPAGQFAGKPAAPFSGKPAAASEGRPIAKPLGKVLGKPAAKSEPGAAGGVPAARFGRKPAGGYGSKAAGDYGGKAGGKGGARTGQAGAGGAARGRTLRPAAKGAPRPGARPAERRGGPRMPS